ncbi:MAG: hypothetical protein JNM18_03275 [Planctomycetaceae bacterium]|nr:hypothetical protein [Planctomycetaceae bacterium]
MDELLTARQAMDDGLAALQRGEFAAAVEQFQGCLQTFLMRGDTAQAARVYICMGEAQQRLGDTLAAYTSFEKAGHHATQLTAQMTETMANSLLGRGVVCLQTNKATEAYLLLNHARQLFESLALGGRVNEIQRLLGQLREQVTPQQWSHFDGMWQQYHNLLQQAQQRRQFTLPLNVG